MLVASLPETLCSCRDGTSTVGCAPATLTSFAPMTYAFALPLVAPVVVKSHSGAIAAPGVGWTK
jgi:hypothetical protein